VQQFGTFSVILFFLASAHAAPPQDKLAKQFVGAWRLISIEGSSRVEPRSIDRPTGIIIYDQSGRVAVQIAYKLDRKPFANALGTPEEKVSAYDSYTAYYGTYTVDAKEGTVTHHLEERLRPGGRGIKNVRYFELKNDRITLMPVEDGKGGVLSRKDATYKLVWERIK